MSLMQMTQTRINMKIVAMAVIGLFIILHLALWAIWGPKIAAYYALFVGILVLFTCAIAPLLKDSEMEEGN